MQWSFAWIALLLVLQDMNEHKVATVILIIDFRASRKFFWVSCASQSHLFPMFWASGTNLGYIHGPKGVANEIFCDFEESFHPIKLVAVTKHLRKDALFTKPWSFFIDFDDYSALEMGKCCRFGSGWTGEQVASRCGGLIVFIDNIALILRQLKWFKIVSIIAVC